MKRTIPSIRFCVAALIACAGCASPPEHGAKYDPLERFPRTAIWVWDEGENALPEGPRFEGLELAPFLEETIDEALTARGYRRGTDASHYRVSYQLGITTRLRPEESIAIGSLSILMRESRSKRPVWLGFARAEIDVTRAPEERRERLRAIVDAMLSDFPPGSDD